MLQTGELKKFFNLPIDKIDKISLHLTIKLGTAPMLYPKTVQVLLVISNTRMLSVECHNAENVSCAQRLGNSQ